MTVTSQPILVLLSIGVAILGSLTALALASAAAARGSDARQRRFSLANAGLIMGATIWSMHFIAMMAVEIPVLVNYDLLETTGSICIAVVATGVGLFLAGTRKLGCFSIPLGGVLMGFGISGMHYLGMGAIRGCGLAYDLQLVAASVAIAIAASTAALWFAFRRRNLVMTVAGGVVQGLAIASMHYTAMAATYFVPLEVDVALSTPLFSQSLIAYIIACGILAISVGNLAMSGLISRDNMTREQIRLVQESFDKIEPIAPQVIDLLYRRLFERSPHLRALFPADLTEPKDKLVTMLALAVLNLHRVQEIVPAVRDLGRRHMTYGVTKADYEPVGEALLWALGQALREQFTPQVKSAWLAAYKLLSSTMIAAADEQQPAPRSAPLSPELRRQAA